MSVAVIRYYVSQQHGSDSNTGLSEAQAWATLTKAAQTVQTPAVGDKHEVVWGPGTYREKISFSYGGRSLTECIQYIPDPNCLYLTQDKPGRCRITGCDSGEIASSGTVVSFGSREYIIFGSHDAECWVDGTTVNAVVSNNPSCWTRQIRVNAQGGYNGFSNCAAPLNCTTQGGSTGFSNCAAPLNCTAQGGSYGFSNCTAPLNCTVQGSSTGFSNCAAPLNCTAQGVTGFYNCAAPTNCTAQGSSTGFNTCAAPTNCTAQGSSYGFYSSPSNITALYDCTVGGCYNNTTASNTLGGDGTVTVGPTILGRIGQMPFMSAGIRGLGTRTIVDTRNTDRTGATLALTVERLIAYTPTADGVSRGVIIYVDTPTAAGNITCELQKYVDGAWQTQRSKTLSATTYPAKSWWRFLWDTGAGDAQTTPVANTWRYRVTADADAQNTTIGTSNGTLISYIGLYEPDVYPASTDIDGRPRPATPSIGAYEPPDMAEEWTTYKTAAPAIKLTGNSMHIMKVAAAKNKQITVKWWIRHHGTASDKKPQIWLKGPGLTTQTATCTAAADTWEQVSVSITPTRDTVLDVCLYARDPATGAYSIFSDPEVS